MIEKDFVDGLIKTLEAAWSGVVYLRSSDRFNLGVPDLLAWVPGELLGQKMPWSIAIEAKAIRPLMEDPFHRGRRTGDMLKHPFTGPQISMLRMLKRAGVEAFGLVRASEETAFRIEPNDLSAATGNFSHEELVDKGHVVERSSNGWWRFWGP